MLNKELRKHSRKELLQLLLEVTKENERLKEENKALENEVKNQTIIITEKNSVAEVGIKITGVFDIIEQVKSQYLQENMVQAR